jgi:signal transduction histidine kinase
LLVIGDGRVQLANARTSDLLGWSKAELEQRNTADVFAEGELERLEELDRQQQSGWAPPETLRLRLKSRLQAEVPVDVRFSRHGGWLVLCARDYTEASRAEKLMRELASIAARLSSTEDVIGLLAACAPAFSDLGWTVAYSSVDADRVTPRHVSGPPGDPIAEYGRSLVGKSLPPSATPIAAEVLRLGRAVFLDDLPSKARGAVRDARALDAQMRVAQVRRSVWCPIWTEGRISALLSVAGGDLTDHDFVAVQLLAAQLGATAKTHALQNERIHRERLAAMGEVSAILAHEVRNPLAVIANASAVLRRAASGVDGAAAPLDIVDEEVQRLKTLMSDVLDFARPDRSSPELVQVGPLLEDAIAAVRCDPTLSAGSSSLWHVDIAEALPDIRVPRQLLQRVFVNLIANACSHVDEGGRISISAEAAEAGVRVSVYNEGRPVPESARPHVFEPFFTTRQEGTGLGLFVVHRSMQLLGGTVALEPRDDGVQFNVELPAR